MESNLEIQLDCNEVLTKALVDLHWRLAWMSSCRLLR
jgi:hypothetical protein